MVSTLQFWLNFLDGDLMGAANGSVSQLSLMIG